MTNRNHLKRLGSVQDYTDLKKPWTVSKQGRLLHIRLPPPPCLLLRVLEEMTQFCSNPYCKRTSPGDGPTCRWHIRNCGTEDRPNNVTLCNACKINFDQGKYCPYCIQIYREKDPDSFDGKEWIGCDNKSCRRWVHVDCEIACGNCIGEKKHYICPSCRDHSSEFGERKRKPIPILTVFELSASAEAKSSTDVGYPLGSETPRPRPGPKVPGKTRVDLSKLETASLKRYKRAYKLQNVSSSCKEDLLKAIARHFATQSVDEQDVLELFSNFVRKQHSYSSSPQSSLDRPYRIISKQH